MSSLLELAQLIEQYEERDAHHKATIKRLQKKHRKLTEQRTEFEEAVRLGVGDAFAAVDLPPVPTPHVDHKSDEVEVCVPLLADWQLGKKTPDYDTSVGRERIERFADEVITTTEMRRQSRTITECHVACLGDMVEGEDIFPGQAWLIDGSTYSQVKDAAELLANFARKMAAHFETVKLTCVIGNHGRVGRKGQYHPETNMDRMVYFIASILTADEDRITFHFTEPGNEGDRGWYEQLVIGDYRALLVHGDQFRGTLGIPWYGIRKKVLGWKAMATNDRVSFPMFDDVFFGHWHQAVAWTINGIGVYGAGSPESYNAFAAENLAAMSVPSQRLLYVSPRKGMVVADHKEVWLD